MTQISLTSPAAVTILLDRSKIFSVAPGISSYLTVAIPAESVAQSPTTATDYGPYLADREVTLNLFLGTVVYEVKESAGGGAVSAASIVTALDEATPAELAEIQASVSGDAAQRTAPLYVTTFGDSTANIGTATDYRESVPVFPASGATQNSFGITRLAAVNYYPRLVVAGNCGISGETTKQMLARDTLAYSTARRALVDILISQPDVVFYRGGSINDIQNTVNNTNVSTTAAEVVGRHLSIVSKMVSMGLTVIDTGIFGYGVGSAAVSATPDAVRACLLLINAAVKSGVAQYGRKVTFLETSGLTHDGTGLFLPGITYDGLHLTPYGGEVHGAAEAAVLTRLFGPSAGRGYSGQLLWGDNFSTTSAVAAGVRPTGWATAGTGCTITAEGVGVVDGYWAYYVDATITAASGLIYAYAQLPVATLGVLANERIGCDAAIGAASTSGCELTSKYHRVTLYDPTNTKRYISEVTSGAEVLAPATPTFLNVRHPPIKFPSDLATFAGTSTRLEIAVNFGAGQVGKHLRLYLTPPKIVKT